MTVTEFATLELNIPITSDPLPSIFNRLRVSQSSWSGYPIPLYANTKSPSTIYLISGWESVLAHQKWIASAENQEILKLLEPYANITGFSHLTLEFEEFQKGCGRDGEFEGVLAVRNDGKGWPVDNQPTWTGQGNDLEDENRTLFQLGFYKGYADIGFEEPAVQVMKRLEQFRDV